MTNWIAAVGLHEIISWPADQPPLLFANHDYDSPRPPTISLAPTWASIIKLENRILGPPTKRIYNCEPLTGIVYSEKNSSCFN